jgi:Fe-S cluster biogenesis protein NfuA
MAIIIIGLLIAGYTGYLIVRQIKNMKAGNFCGGCSGCPSAKRCEQFKDDEERE